ncbi:unnamed protein product [Kuraishia capsulata CBS 1993]|uniref:Patatin-like phospholipase domain-containing protein n=1 Tax=Kuraishia capsulata CBS 1993 TaxID=1382522 RepID=W6MT75_9ASCO|nr:uncharacterized protein KUCA_T00005938001 [Kuraishia capsulata CBS 1993]CDK29944.1 unnamed protein product [Kuraishia capsulata CBS 1993]
MSGIKDTVLLDPVRRQNPFENITEGFINQHHFLIENAKSSREWDSKSLAYELSELSWSKVVDDVVDATAKVLRNIPILRHVVGPPLEHAAQVNKLLAQQKAATSYSEWRATSLKLDKLLQNDAWKKKMQCTLYDYELINNQLEQLRTARQSGDYKKLLFLIRTGISRNIGNMGNVNLYRHSHVGTKSLIEDFLAECELSLETLSRGDTGLDDSFVLGTFIQTRKNVGRTALVLSGGGTFGMLHIGVLATLLEEGLLPKIIAGSSAGAIVASILCSRTSEGLKELMVTLTQSTFEVFDKKPGDGFLGCMARFLKYGTYFDISNLQDTMKEFLGDLTFRECYNRTGRILNVTVSAASVHEQPTLLNYLTAPNVLIWSAVCASCSLPGVFASSTIYEKMRTNEIQEWSNPMIKFVDGSVHGDLPITRLSEMFNVDHIIACQVNPHIAPWLKMSIECVGGEMENEVSAKIKRMLNRTYGFWVDEAMHYLEVCNEIGIATNLCTKLISVVSQKYSGDITILPDLRVLEYTKVLKNPTPEFILDATVRGARATWSKLSIINNHCAVEFALDRSITTIRSRLILSRGTSVGSSPVSLLNLHKVYLNHQKKNTKRNHDRRSSDNIPVNGSTLSLRRVRSKSWQIAHGRRNSNPENSIPTTRLGTNRMVHASSIPSSSPVTLPVSPYSTKITSSYFDETHSPTHHRQGRQSDLMAKRIDSSISKSPVPKVMMNANGIPRLQSRLRAQSFRDVNEPVPPASPLRTRSGNMTYGSLVDFKENYQITQGQIIGTMDDDFARDGADDHQDKEDDNPDDQMETSFDNNEIDQVQQGFSYYDESDYDDGEFVASVSAPNSRGK